MKTNIFSNLIWKFSGRTLAQGISFIVSIILARVLCPEDFGTVAFVLIFIDIANTLVISGFSTALIQKKIKGTKENKGDGDNYCNKTGHHAWRGDSAPLFVLNKKTPFSPMSGEARLLKEAV